MTGHGNPHGRRPSTNSEHVVRLMSKVSVTATGCWEYQGRKDLKGYTRIGIGPERMLTHRAAWMLRHGPIPAGLFVCHGCDNPPCCNPAHMFLGTAADNNADMAAKGRAHKTGMAGELHPGSKLTRADVAEIRQLVAAGGLTQEQIGSRFGVGQTQVWRIAHHYSWVAA